MPFRGRRRFISLLVYKMYKPLTSAPGRFAFPVSSLWPLAVPSETMTMDIRAAKEQIVGHLRKAPKASSPEDIQSYVGSPVPVLGLTVPTMRAIVAGFAKEHGRLTAAELNALASGPIAGLVFAKPSRFRDLLRWTRAKNIWRRRASTYGLHRFVRAGELDKPLQLLEKLLYDEEFWVQQAVGTWLRECWKKDRRRTEAFLRDHAEGLPPVTITVATERAPKAFRLELRQKATASVADAERHDRRRS